MKIIAHRANINGPDSKKENKKSRIKDCIDLGFDVEIDIRLLDGKLYLGHDIPEAIITKEELREIRNKVWIHCKNLNALQNVPSKSNYFWHQTDDFTLTSKGYIWTFPEKKVGKKRKKTRPPGLLTEKK